MWYLWHSKSSWSYTRCFGLACWLFVDTASSGSLWRNDPHWRQMFHCRCYEVSTAPHGLWARDGFEGQWSSCKGDGFRRTAREDETNDMVLKMTSGGEKPEWKLKISRLIKRGDNEAGEGWGCLLRETITWHRWKPLAHLCSVFGPVHLCAVIFT